MKTKIIAGIGVSIFVVLCMVSGFLGLYSIKKSNEETSGYIEAVDLARQVQFYLQKQSYLWKILVLQGNEYKEYRNNYHAFTFYADRVQDSLFNLKLLSKNIRDIPEKITELRKLHTEITRDYSISLIKLTETGFSGRKGIFLNQKEKDSAVLLKMDEIVRIIERSAEKEIEQINENYYNLVLISIIFITFAALAAGIYFSYELTDIHRGLEIRVKERTKELAALNEELRSEIVERKKTEELLKKAKEEAEEAGRRIGISENKYKYIIEESNDIIFSLDEHYHFITANRALSTHLKISPLTIAGISFLDLLHEGVNGRTATKQFIREKLETFSRERRPIEFTTQFILSFASEPKEMHVRMEFISIEGIDEIHGIASAVTEDTLLNYFVSERQKYLIGNYLSNIEDVTRRITRNLSKYIDSDKVSYVRIGLREMIINAIEHGNLEISFEEKTEALNEDKYIQLIESRRNNPEFFSRKVEIEYQIKPGMAVYRITDQGRGFNHSETVKKCIPFKDGEVLSHGRGILMSKEIFNEIRYNEKGNQVLLVKKY
ncbi:MAG: ATP-binding protein [Spirochaetes bacterium]|nr:ATP-binding protein [Spirochaetota bacterium]